MSKKILSGTRKVLVFLSVAVLLAFPLSTGMFAEGPSEQTNNTQGVEYLNDSQRSLKDVQAFFSEEEAPSSGEGEESELPQEPEGTGSSVPEPESEPESSGGTDSSVPEDSTSENPDDSSSKAAPEYSVQPTSLQEVQETIDVYEAALAEYFANGGDFPIKPRWEHEVAQELMPNTYYSGLVEGDEAFDAPYYTFFARVQAMVATWAGSGTEQDPYLLSTAADLKQLSQDVNSGISYSGSYFLVTKDIVLNDLTWVPIGAGVQELSFNHTSMDTSKAFKGNFNGGGHTVSTFTVGNAAVSVGVAGDYKGFFGLVENASIRNLIIANATVSGGSGLGALVGYASGNITIEDCMVLDSAVFAFGINNMASGGMIGMVSINNGAVINIVRSAVSNTQVTSTAPFGRVGGMIGDVRAYSASRNDNMNASVLLEKNIVTGGKVNSQYYYVGGLIGEIDFYNSGSNNVTIRDTQTNIHVNATGGSGYYVGGFIGFTQVQGSSPANHILVEGGRALGKVTAASYYIGGLIGYIEITASDATRAIPTTTIIRNSYATGDVSTTYNSASNIGGFIGHAHAGDNLPAGAVLVESSYSTGNVQGSGYNVGGFMGRPTKNVLIRNSYSTGDVFSATNQVGGFIGYAEGNETYGNVLVENCFSTGNVVGLGQYVGGFVGLLQASQVINSYSVGSVHSTNHSTGGFIGRISYISKVTNSFSAGHVTSTSITNIGGFIGITGPEKISVTDCFFDGTTSQKTAGIGSKGGATVGGVTRLNTREMITKDKFNVSWKMRENRFGAAGGAGNNASPWYIDNDITYPYLYFQYDGKAEKETNYNLGSVLYSDDRGISYKPLAQFQTDFTFPTIANLRFEVKTAGAAQAFFPYTHGINSGDFNAYRYLFTAQSLMIPFLGDYPFMADTPYSLGSISQSGIVAFASSPYAEKTSNRTPYEAGQTSTYTYVGDRVTYSVFAVNYSREFAWRNIVFTDVLLEGLSLVPDSVKLDGVPVQTSGLPLYTYDATTRTLKVSLQDMPKNDVGSPVGVTITFEVDIDTPAASIFPLDPSADNIRNRADVTGDLYQDDTFISTFAAPVDDENTDPVFPKYKVVYNGNGGQADTNQEQVIDGYYLPATKYTVKGNDTVQFQKQGYHTLGWNTSADGSGTSYTEGQEIQMDQDVTLYAVWQENPTLALRKIDGLKSESSVYEGLAGAKFTLYQWTGAQNIPSYPSLLEGGTDWQQVGEATSNEIGNFSFTQLEVNQTFLLIESTAPVGYELPNAQWLVYVSATGDITFGDMLSGKPAYAIQDIGGENHIANYTLSQSYELPDAGGEGIATMLIIGATLIMSAVIGLVTFRKYAKHKKQFARIQANRNRR